MYPAFVNCTTIDWFSEWPMDALLEVADKYLDNIQMGSEEEVLFSRHLLYIWLLFLILISEEFKSCNCLSITVHVIIICLRISHSRC